MLYVHQRGADLKILCPRRSIDFDERSVSASADGALRSAVSPRRRTTSMKYDVLCSSLVIRQVLDAHQLTKYRQVLETTTSMLSIFLMSQVIQNKNLAKNERIGSGSVHVHRFSCAKTAKKIRCQSAHPKHAAVRTSLMFCYANSHGKLQ